MGANDKLAATFHPADRAWFDCFDELPIWTRLAFELDLAWDAGPRQLFFYHRRIKDWPVYDR